MMKKWLNLLENTPNSRLGCTNHTLFHTKMAKKNHILWRSKYLYSLYKGLPSRAKNALQIMSLTAYASGTNKG